MAKYSYGEVIHLNWESGTPEELYIVGHLNPGDASAKLNEHYEGEYKFETPEPVYARWSCEYPITNDLGVQVLRIYKDRAKRRFPIMRARVVQDTHGHVEVE